MRLDGIDKEIMIINPYRKLETIDQKNSQPIQTNTDQINIQTDSEKQQQNTHRVTMSQEELNRMMEEIRHKFSMLEKYLQIDIDEQLQIPISKIIDMRTEEIIRQIPPDWIVDILRRMEELRGVFYSKEA
ncbi:MAG: flagellar protein FlaG [Thermodesulfovibrio sp.]|jgi:flagellar protein FlaG|uniref:flagellar protein FlaG n=1 Tax=Thermodesulfovibrio sp. 1176 TaxID=3043424 RepID=UPI0024830D52|nr:flagellar protein FlaG [Thermodesulfovibrio sp. 1176]MDI1471686.1 flagellar protein FlaG [Thermodesulfovibrio sp. 1176]MDI6713578.1 flagellar protein FlaG [Thermodesulfovibrio sp.]